MKPRVDLSKYAGMPGEQVNRRMAEEERRAVMQDPRASRGSRH
jgi:hypothetical protein